MIIRGGNKNLSTPRRYALAAALCVFFGAGAAQAATLGETDDAKGMNSLANLIKNMEAAKSAPPEMSPTTSESAAPPDQAAQTIADQSAAPAGTALAIAKPPSVPAVASPPQKVLTGIAQVKAHYKQGKFRDGLNLIATMKPTELTHYYAGLCYQGQGQLKQAAYEFNIAANHAKDPMVRYNAQLALQSVDNYARSRTYAGQGNSFARAPAAASRGGGGGGAVRRG